MSAFHAVATLFLQKFIYRNRHYLTQLIEYEAKPRRVNIASCDRDLALELHQHYTANWLKEEVTGDTDRRPATLDQFSPEATPCDAFRSLHSLFP
jgi:hypothetical protein